MPNGPPRVGRQGFNASVHGARGLFALLVFAFHIANSGLPTFYPDQHWLAVTVFGSFKFGVELFFGISGFVIVGALARARSIRVFLWDRATRIYPLLWVTLLAISATSLAVGHWMPPLGDWLLNFLAPPPVYNLPQVNPAAWSLGYEVGFYMLAGLCWYAARKVKQWRLGAFLIGISLIVLLPRAILMPAGVLIAAGWLQRPAVVRAAAMPGVWLIVFLLLWRRLELLSPAHDIARFTPLELSAGHWLEGAPLMLVAGLAGGLALRGIVEQRGALTALLRTRVFQALGTSSFSFYLWHPVLMGPIKAVLRASGGVAALGPGAQVGLAVLALPPALIVAHYSQRLIEVRVTRWLRRHGPLEDAGHAPITATADDLPPAARVPRDTTGLPVS